MASDELNPFLAVRRNLQGQSKRVKWARDPVLWAKERLGVDLWSVQREISYSLRDNKRTAVAACHGPGKSFLAAALSCWWIDTHPLGDAIVVSTAPTYAQVNKILWEEMRKMHRRAADSGNPLPGRITQGDEWKLDNGEIVGFGRKPADGDSHAFQGIHRTEGVLAVIDESCGVPEEIWTGAEAITTTDESRILAIGNPDDRNTEFGRVFLSPDYAGMWNRISIPAHATPNFTGEQVPALLNKVLISQQWAEDAARRWGKDDPRYISKVEARFPDVSASSLFSPDLVMKMMPEEDDQPKQTSYHTIKFGVDVARFGSDDNVLVSNVNGVLRVEDRWGGTDTVSSAQRVLDLAQEIRAGLSPEAHVEFRVDAVGLGAGVVDTLTARAAFMQQMGLPVWFTVHEMHGQAAAPKDMGGSTGGYGNARAYWFDQLKLTGRSGGVKIIDSSPRLDRPYIAKTLREELGMIFYKYNNGRLYIMSKEEMREKYGKSPDIADAVAYAMAPIYTGPRVGDTVVENPHALLKQLQFEQAQDAAAMQIAPC